MRQAEQDGEHIWLRQSVTFTANGQTRTVEMAIPLRPGAPDEEIERLLTDAEAGMRRISERLDSHVAALLNGSSAPVVASHATTPPMPATPATPATATQPASTPSMPAPTAATPSPRPAPAPTPTPAAPPARSQPSGPLPASIPAPAALAGTELSRKDFIAAAGDMGLTVKQVMERLHVRSLEGLDLREALEALRRQMLRDGESQPAAATSATPTASTPTTPRRAAPTPAPAPAAPRYFEEEDDDVTFTMDGEDALAEEFGSYEAPGMPSPADASASGGGDLEDLDALSDLDLDDVPDFGPPPSAARTSHAAHASPPPSRRSAPAKAAPTTPAPPVEEHEPEPSVSPEVQRVAQLRAVRGGGAPTTHQRAAYRNIVVNELGEEAAALVRGIWRINPERLGPEQLDALISWGKQDTFSEEAAAVLAALRAERQQAAATAAPTTAPESASATNTPHPAPRPRTPQPPRASSGGR